MAGKQNKAKVGVRACDVRKALDAYENEVRLARRERQGQSVAASVPGLKVREELAPWEICKAMVATTVEEYGVARTLAAVLVSVAASVAGAVRGVVMGRQGAGQAAGQVGRAERGQG